MALYQAAFDATLRWVNRELAPQVGTGGGAEGGAEGSGPSTPPRGVALLDVFGFEVLRTNSLEQLLINYTNEKLHQHFLRCTVQEEQRVYAAEGLAHAGAQAPPTPVSILPHRAPAQMPGAGAGGTNDAILSLLESRPSGLLACLESTCRLPNGSDAAFVRDLFAQNEAAKTAALLRRPHNAAASRNQKALASDDGFQLAHFHSIVQYSAHGFVSKNRDVLSAPLTAAVERQSDRLWTALVGASATATVATDSLAAAVVTPPLRIGLSSAVGAPAAGTTLLPLRGARAGARGPASLSEGHRARLASLLTSLDPRGTPVDAPDAGVHNFFIKCIKPNDVMRPDSFHGGYVLRQLRMLGVLQAVALIKQGFPHRIAYTEIHSRYSPLLATLARADQPGSRKLAKIGAKGLVTALLATEALREREDYVLGASRVFLRLGKAQLLERMLSQPPAEVVPDLMRRLQSHAARVASRAVLRIAMRRGLHRRRAQREREAAAATRIQTEGRRRLAVASVQRARDARGRARAEAARRAELEEQAVVEAARRAEEAEKAAEVVREAARLEAARRAVLPRLPLFLAREGGAMPLVSTISTGAAAKAMAGPSNEKLALDSAVHRLLFAHWAWGAPGAGQGTTDVDVRAVGSATLQSRGMRHETALRALRAPSPKKRREANEARAATGGGGAKGGAAQNGLLGWTMLLLLLGAYLLVSALPLLHWVGWVPSHFLYHTA